MVSVSSFGDHGELLFNQLKRSRQLGIDGIKTCLGFSIYLLTQVGHHLLDFIYAEASRRSRLGMWLLLLLLLRLRLLL